MKKLINLWANTVSKFRKKRFKIYIIFFIAILLAVFLYYENNTLSVTNISIVTNKVKDDIVIVHLSDLHNKEFGKDNINLIKKIKAQKPDIIVFTGDLISRGDKDYTKMLHTLIEINKISAVYYLPGNHEYGFKAHNELFAELKKNNIKVMINSKEKIKIKNSELSIFGLDLASISKTNAEKLLEIYQKDDTYKLLLAHFPENFDNLYSKYKVDLVLFGHAH